MLDAAVLHKTEVGGVHLGVRTHAELDAALGRARAAGARRFLVESMAPPGVDLDRRRAPRPGVRAGRAARARRHDGRGAGRRRRARWHRCPWPRRPRCPTNWPAGPARRLARRAGAGPDASSAASCAPLGGLLDANPQLDEIEINPLRLTADGLVALDAVVDRESTRRVPMVSPIADGVVPWPDEDVERYVAAGYWDGRAARRTCCASRPTAAPDAVALVDGDRAADATPSSPPARTPPPAALLDLGLRAGDRIVVQLPNGWEFVVLTLRLPARRHRAGDGAARRTAARAGLPRPRTPRPPRSPCPTGCATSTTRRSATSCADEMPTSLEHVLVAGDAIDRRAASTCARCAPTGDPTRPRTGTPTSRTAATWRCSCCPAARPGCRS